MHCFEVLVHNVIFTMSSLYPRHVHSRSSVVWTCAATHPIIPHVQTADVLGTAWLKIKISHADPQSVGSDPLYKTLDQLK